MQLRPNPTNRQAAARVSQCLLADYATATAQIITAEMDLPARMRCTIEIFGSGDSESSAREPQIVCALKQTEVPFLVDHGGVIIGSAKEVFEQ